MNELLKKELEQEYRCLSVKQPFATMLVRPTWRAEDGTLMGEKSIELRSKSTKYRGDVLICASKKPEVAGMKSGCALGLVELYDVKPVSEFTEEDWQATCIRPEERGNFRGEYGWLMRNPRRVIEVPISGKLGLFQAKFPADTIIEYPRAMMMDAEGWAVVRRRLERATRDTALEAVKNLLAANGAIDFREIREAKDVVTLYAEFPFDAPEETLRNAYLPAVKGRLGNRWISASISGKTIAVSCKIEQK